MRMITICLMVFGNLARYLYEQIQKNNMNDTVKRSYEFLNELAASPNSNVADLAVVGVFEILVDYPEVVKISRKFLSGKAAEDFEKVLKGESFN